MSEPGVLHGVVQPYAWGSVDALPRIMGTHPTGEPQAELWLGAHPRGLSLLRREGTNRPLNEVIAADTEAELGEETARRFGNELPFLLKILAIDKPLSLQTHPNRHQAEEGFAAENEWGIPIDAYNRLYRDRNHKPELICALEPFTALCGFRSSHSTVALIESLEIPGLGPFVELLSADETDRALRWLLEQPPEAGAVLARQVAHACTRPGPFAQERQWAVRIGEHHPGDIGVAIALMLNLVRLEPGQSLYLGAGNLHVYLHGVAVEIMANSDNVLRGGLTPKHVDIPALLDVVDYRPLEVPITTPDGPLFDFFPPVPDFRLTRMEVDGKAGCRGLGPEIVLCASGRVSVAGHDIGSGGAVWIPAGTGDYEVAGTGLVFRAQVGSLNKDGAIG